MATIKIVSARTAAPSFKALRIAGYTKMPKKGQPPVNCVIVATDEQGRKWQHEAILPAGHLGLVRKVRDAGVINPVHWRLTKGEY